jgi:hypothetical protein
MSRPLLALAAALLVLPAAASAEIRNGSIGAGRMKPADPDVRIKRALLSYDTAGTVSGTVTADGTLEGKNVSAVFYLGTYDRTRKCADTAARPNGGVGGVTGTFSYPPVVDPTSFIPAATRLAFLGDDILGPDGVTYSSLGASATITGTVGQLADRPWNCGWVTLKDLGIEKEEVDDRTPDFPLGKRAIAENRRLLRKALKRCTHRQRAAKRATCRSAARERFPD